MNMADIEETDSEALVVRDQQPVTPEVMQAHIGLHDHSTEKWHRLDGEPHLLYQYFKLYCQDGLNGHKRTQDRIAKKVRKSLTYIQDCASLWRWKERAQDYDDHLQAVEQDALESQLQADNIEWAKRKRELREMEWATAMALIKRAQAMLDWPLVRETIETSKELTEEGLLVKTIIYKEPTAWTLADAGRIFELASKIARLAAGMSQSSSTHKVKIDFNNAPDDVLERLAAGEMP
jgi:hypothetical protein